MSFRKFLSSKALTLCFLGLGYLGLTVYLLMWGITPALWFFFSILFSGLVLLWILAEFLRLNSRLKKLHRLLDGISDPYLAGEVLPEPSDSVERAYFLLMRRVSRSAIEQTEEARREKEEYCRYVESWIHEIKTPLTACSLMLDNQAEPRKLRRELKRAENLTDTILYYARMRTPWKDMKPEEVSLEQLSREAVQSQTALLIFAGISVEVTGEAVVFTDRKNLLFMVKQLLINCAKYCPGCRIRITAREGQLTVRDNGIGIPDHEVARATERGFTGSNGRRLGTSTGMGLYLVDCLCQNMGIRLAIRSREGCYTEISFQFPSLTKM